MKNYNFPKYDVVTRDGTIIKRHDDLTIAPAQGLYNQQLFDLCADDSLLALGLFGQYEDVLDVIGFQTSDVMNVREQFLTYVAASGAAAGAPTSGVQTDPCAPGESVEAGGCGYLLSGFGRLRRASPVRDITDINVKWCDTQPRYTIAGERIDDDHVWDMMNLGSVIIQDFQRQFISGDATNPGEHDGLERIVDFGYLDPDSGLPCTAMDSFVIDWGGNAMCPDGGVEGINFTVNGVAGAAGNFYTLIDMIYSWVRRMGQRIRMSSLSGGPQHVGLLPSEHLNCLISCYVCQVVCARDVTRMDSQAAIDKLESLRSQLGTNGAVTLSFDGIPITFYPFDWGLLNPVSGNGDIYILTPNVGNTPIMRFHMKDMASAQNATAKSGNYYLTMDGGRWLAWENFDNTCFQVNLEMQWRIYCRAPWLQLRITDVQCDTVLGNISNDPLSAFYIEQNLQAYAVA